VWLDARPEVFCDKSLKYLSWKSMMRILFPFPIFFQQNKDTNQSERRPRLVFVDALKRAVWNVFIEWCFNFFLEFFFGGVSLVYTSMLFTIILTWLLNSWKAWRTSSNASCCSLNVSSMVCRDARLEYRITSVTVVQTVQLVTQMSLLLISRSLNERRERKNFFF